MLAFCWAHVRRDFLAVARSWPEQEAWALGWVERIGALYACNDRRLEAPRASPQFAARDQEVRQGVAAMDQQREQELAQAALHPARRKQGLRTRFLGDLGQYSQEIVVLPSRNQAPSGDTLAFAGLLRLEQT